MRLLKEILQDTLHSEEKVYTVQYRPIKLYHPVAGFSYGIKGEWTDEHGEKIGTLVMPDISCDYMFVSRLAAKCTVAQLDSDQLLELLDRFFI